MREVTSRPPSWKCDVKSEIQRIFALMNVPAKFHPSPIWNDGGGFLDQVEEHSPEKNKKWLAISYWSKIN